jgi:hypothetical protein
VELSDAEHPDSAAVKGQIELVEPQEFTPQFHEPVTMADASARDIGRQTGDTTVWKYYLKTASYKHSLFFVLLVLGSVR